MDQEFVGPFASWANVVDDYGAVGDGTTDDYSAIQVAMDELGTSGHASVLYFPAGTYKITFTAFLVNKQNVRIVGEDPATTIIKWGGDSAPTTRDHDTMFWIYGVAYSGIERLTFDGAKAGGGNAYAAIYQAWDSVTGPFDTGNAYVDNTYKDVFYGYNGGDLNFGCAETTLMRNHFLRCSSAGIQLRNFNALDIWAWYCHFEDCAKGVSNNPGAGNWRVYHCFFEGSTTTDLDIGNTGVFSARFNTSLGSEKFLTTTSTGNPAEILLQGNAILDPVQSKAIHIQNHGPAILIDNTIRSLVGATAPIVHASQGTGDLVTIGNTFTVSSPITAAGRSIDQDTSVVTVGSLSGLGAPTLPSTATSQSRTVFDLTVGDNATTIQAAIDDAHAEGDRSVVHFPAGNYNINTTLTIPANSDVQLVGDSFGETSFASKLTWTGSAGVAMLQITGPTHATIRDLGFTAAGGKGIVATGLDQANARVYGHDVVLQEATSINLLVTGLDKALVDLRDLNHKRADSGVSVKVSGGVLGTGRVRIFSGASSTNLYSYSVENGGTLLVRDVWYETGGSGPSTWVRLQGTVGTLILESLRVFTPYVSGAPAIVLDPFTGTFVLLGSLVDDRVELLGGGAALDALVLGMTQDNHLGLRSTFYTDTTSPAADARLLSSRTAPSGGGSTQITNIGTADSSFLNAMLTETRAAVATVLPTSYTNGRTDLRFLRVSVRTATVGLELQGEIPSGSRRVLVRR